MIKIILNILRCLFRHFNCLTPNVFASSPPQHRNVLSLLIYHYCSLMILSHFRRTFRVSFMDCRMQQILQKGLLIVNVADKGDGFKLRISIIGSNMTWKHEAWHSLKKMDPLLVQWPIELKQITPFKWATVYKWLIC